MSRILVEDAAIGRPCTAITDFAYYIHEELSTKSYEQLINNSILISDFLVYAENRIHYADHDPNRPNRSNDASAIGQHHWLHADLYDPQPHDRKRMLMWSILMLDEKHAECRRLFTAGKKEYEEEEALAMKVEVLEKKNKDLEEALLRTLSGQCGTNTVIGQARQ